MNSKSSLNKKPAEGMRNTKTDTIDPIKVVKAQKNIFPLM